MKAPQIIMIALVAVNLCLSAYLHGKERTGKNSFWTMLIGQAMYVGLLIWGGFFR